MTISMPVVNGLTKRLEYHGIDISKDPQHRIGQLEGAIMAALPYLNGLLNYATLQGEDTSDAAKVIANLKAIVKEEK